MEQSTHTLSLEDSYKHASAVLRQRMPDMGPEDIYDLVQEAVIGLWSRQAEIVFPSAYLRHIVHSRYIDLLRRRKGRTMLPLILDADGEITQGQILFLPYEGNSHDPVREFERKEFLEEIITHIVKLPHRQRYAMICVLKDEVGDTFPLLNTFKRYGIDIETICWPQEDCELHRLRCSLTVARKTLRSMQK